MKILIFFTSQFPFGDGETFVENEFPFLANAFEKIFIVTNNVSGKQTRNLPENVVVIRIPYATSSKHKLQALFNYFNPAIQHELNFIKNKLHLPVSPKIISTLLGSYAHAFEINELILKITNEHNIDLKSLYLYSYWMNNMAAGAALFKQKHPETKAICRAHGWDVYFERHNPPYLPLRNFIVENLDACFCISENGKQYLENIVSAPLKNHIKISRLGTFNTLNKKNEPANNSLSIVSCSNIIPLKRINLIIDALSLIKDIQITWTHFGDGELAAEIKNYRDKVLSSKANIKYSFAGQISNKELLVYYSKNAVDVFINASETEGLPVSIMEAFSFGIPAIAMNVGGVSEIIQGGINGVLLKADSGANEIAAAIINFHSLSEAEKNKFRSEAFNTWDEKFNAEKNYSSFIEYISTL